MPTAADRERIWKRAASGEVPLSRPRIPPPCIVSLWLPVKDVEITVNWRSYEILFFEKICQMYMIFRIYSRFFFLYWYELRHFRQNTPPPDPHTRFLRTTGCWPNDTLHGRRRLPLTSARVLADDTALWDEKEVRLVYKGDVHAIKRMLWYILPRSTKYRPSFRLSWSMIRHASWCI